MSSKPVAVVVSVQEKARQAIFDTLPPEDGEAEDTPPLLPPKPPTGEELYIIGEYFCRNYVHLNGVGKREWSDTKSDGLYTFYHHLNGRKVLTMKLALPFDHWLVRETVKDRKRPQGYRAPGRFTYTTATWKTWGDVWPKRCNIYLAPESALYRRLYNLVEELIAVCPEPHWRRRP